MEDTATRQQPTDAATPAPLSLSLKIALFAVAGLIRVLVGYQPHSGQDNYHGQRAAYGGDFEAQRHWMELTWHLPVGEWYWYDLEYWGLDYPPISAYLSYICGGLSRVLVSPESVALFASRGYEDPVHKSFMRATVVVTDLLIYGTAVWCLTKPPQSKPHNLSTAWNFGLAMLQPAILLIDHGHFQYNTVALGLSLWAFYYMTLPCQSNHMKGCAIGSILFCLALAFKQMTLYYAPAVFSYLLGRCFASGHTLRKATKDVATLGVTVVTCFALLWWPFIVYGPDDTSYTERAAHVLRRIFPLQRGLFEGKVSNLWCAMSVKPFSIRQRIPVEWQPLAALLLTLLLILPGSYKLFRIGQRYGSSSKQYSKDWLSDRRQLLWGATNCALTFFLASFQVHEKSLLLALAPCTVLPLWTIHDEAGALFVEWFSIVTTWTLWPLIETDRLRTAYVCTILIFASALGLRRELTTSYQTSTTTGGGVLIFLATAATYAIMIGLHVMECFVTAPSHLPDLFPVLWSIVGCGFCGLAWLHSCWQLYRWTEPPARSAKQKVA